MPSRGPDVQAKAEEGGRKLADGFAGAEAKVVDLIGEQARKLGIEVRGHTADLEPQFDSIRTKAHSGLDDVASAINMQLDGVEEASRTELTGVLAEIAGRVDESVKSISEVLDHESAAAADAVDTAAERTATAVLAAKRPNLAVGRRVVTDAEDSIAATAEQYDSGLADVERVTTGSFAQGGAAVARGTARTASGVSKGLGEAAGAGKQALAGVVDAAYKSADAVIEHWANAVDEAAKGLDAGFGKAVAGLGGELQKGLDEGTTKITAQVNQAIAKNAEPMAQLDTKLEEAAAEAREKYDAPWYKKVGRWLLSALKSFLIALLKFLAVVLLVVLAVIAIIVGIIADIVALVIIGVIILVGVLAYVVYAIIAGIVARVRSAHTWWQAIWGVVVGILDITGLPGIVEGLIGHDIVNGRKLTAEEAGSRFGTGLFALLLWLIPLKFRGARGSGGRPPELPGEKPALPPGTSPGPPAEPGLPAEPGPPAEPELPGRAGQQARLDELARDYLDHGGQETPGTRAEAEAALGVEQTEGLGPFRRPRPGEGHAGDFVDETTGTDWDVKRPRSREALQNEIRERAREQGRPEPNLDPNRPIRGEFDLADTVEAIRNELNTGENVIVDTRSLNPDQIAALRAAIADPANGIPAGRVVLWP